MRQIHEATLGFQVCRLLGLSAISTVLWIRIQVGSVFRTFVDQDPEPYS